MCVCGTFFLAFPSSSSLPLSPPPPPSLLISDIISNGRALLLDRCRIDTIISWQTRTTSTKMRFVLLLLLLLLLFPRLFHDRMTAIWALALVFLLLLLLRLLFVYSLFYSRMAKDCAKISFALYPLSSPPPQQPPSFPFGIFFSPPPELVLFCCFNDPHTLYRSITSLGGIIFKYIFMP